MLATGAHLFLTARDMQKGQRAENNIKATNSTSEAKIDVLKLELDSCLQSVRQCITDFLTKSKQLMCSLPIQLQSPSAHL